MITVSIMGKFPPRMPLQSMIDQYKPAYAAFFIAALRHFLFAELRLSVLPGVQDSAERQA
jgi:hypothetical protein